MLKFCFVMLTVLYTKLSFNCPVYLLTDVDFIVTYFVKVTKNVT
jgi:hypothetical protein